MAPEQIAILQHALGLDQYGQAGPYGMVRNHYVAGGRDVAHCDALVAAGYMIRVSDGCALTGGDPGFRVTDAGKEAAVRESPAPPPPTRRRNKKGRLQSLRSKKRYDVYLDGEWGESFSEWLHKRMYECYDSTGEYRGFDYAGQDGFL